MCVQEGSGPEQFGWKRAEGGSRDQEGAGRGFWLSWEDPSPPSDLCFWLVLWQVPDYVEGGDSAPFSVLGALFQATRDGP